MTMTTTNELVEKLKTALRGEGEPGHPGEMISVNEVESLVDEVFADALAAVPATTEADAEALPTKVTNAMLRAAVVHLKDYYEVRNSHGNLRWIVPDMEVRAALEAALAVPAPKTQDGEARVMFEYARRNRGSGRVFPLSGEPYPEWWFESQEVDEHMRREVTDWMPVSREGGDTK